MSKFQDFQGPLQKLQAWNPNFQFPGLSKDLCKPCGKQPYQQSGSEDCTRMCALLIRKFLNYDRCSNGAVSRANHYRPLSHGTESHYSLCQWDGMFHWVATCFGQIISFHRCVLSPSQMYQVSTSANVKQGNSMSTKPLTTTWFHKTVHWSSFANEVISERQPDIWRKPIK